MQTNQRIIEISGRPGMTWGSVFVPTTGTITVRIVGDTLKARLKRGQEGTDSWVRIQNIDSVEIVEAPEYNLLGLGIFLVLWGLGLIGLGIPQFGLILFAAGIACGVYAYNNKRRLLVLYSLRCTIPVFMDKPSGSYQQFAEQVLAIARQLNAPAAIPAQRTENTRIHASQA